MDMQTVVQWIGRIIDLAGVAVIAGGILASFAIFALQVGRRGDRSIAYRDLRETVGRSVLLGLELLVAGDIIRTVALAPSFASVGLLAAIVAIRTFLSTTLEMEINGRWPWQAPRTPEIETAGEDRGRAGSARK